MPISLSYTIPLSTRGRAQHMDEEDPEKAATEHAAMQQRFVALDANGDGQV